MKIKTFKVEDWMGKYENDAIYNLGETCIDSLSLEELINISGTDYESFIKKIAQKRLTYGHIFGSPELTKGIAELYQDVEADNITPTHGAVGANHLVIMTLIGKDDNMVSVLPTYQQHYSIPESIGAEVRILKLKAEHDYLPDIDELRNMVDDNTKLITINNPNNPTGSWIPEDVMKEIVEIARSVDAYVLSDEVYRGISEDGSYMPSIVDLYEKGISVGSMSKCFSLAGLRLGWVAVKDSGLTALMRERRDYDTISCGVLDDMIASLALANREKIFERNRKILLKNREILDQWVSETEGINYVKPIAGTTALLQYEKEIPSYELCIKLIKDKGVLFTPGAAFEMEGTVRIGYAFDSKTLREGLDKFAEFLKEI